MNGNGDTSEARALFQVALRDFLAEWTEPHGKIDDERPWGTAVALKSDGNTTTPQNQKQILFEHQDWPPRQWHVSMHGETQGAVDEGCWPGLAKFVISVGNAGATEEYEIDCFGDSTLSCWGERVRAMVMFEDAHDSLTYPKHLRAIAQLAQARGWSTARRTLFVPAPEGGATTALPIPRGSRGVIIRTATAFGGLIGAITFKGCGVPMDSLTAASVAAAHDRGEYVSVPSLADVLEVTTLAKSVNPVSAEFEIRP